MVGFIIFSVIVLIVGFVGGFVTKHIIDRDAFRHANLNALALRREIAYLRKVQKGKVIEIKDERLDNFSELDFPNS